QVSLKVAPLPQESAVWSAEFVAPATALAAGKRLQEGGLPLTGLVLAGWQEQWSLAARFAGSEAAVRRSTGVAGGNAADAGAWDASLRPLQQAAGAVVLKVVVRPSDCAGVIAAVPDDARVVAYPAAGVVYVTFSSLPSDFAGCLKVLRERAGPA